MNSGVTRRELIGTAGLVAAAATMGRTGDGLAAQSAATPLSANYSKARVLRIFIGAHAGWPRPDLDIDAETKRLQGEIDKVKGLEDIEFVGNLRVPNHEVLAKVLQEHKDVSGILAVQVCMGTSEILNMLANSGIPTVLFATLYSGHEWCIVPDLQRAGKKIDVIPSSNFDDVLDAIRPFRAIHRLRETRVLYIGGGHAIPGGYAENVKKQFGTTIVPFDHKRLAEAYEAVPADVVEAEARRWTSQAEKVVEPSPEEIAKASRLCLAMQNVLAEEKAQAMTINCLGLFAINGLPAYPCFGFVRLNDIGLIGVCEADLPSTMTQVIYQHMIGKPGFVTDPIFDTSNNTVIHAHCVAATRMDGPSGKPAPYIIRSHLEDHKGAVLQTKMRIGQQVTMAKLVTSDPKAKANQHPTLAASPADCYGLGTMLISTGTIVDVPDVDRACRTKITVKVRDARKMLEGWSYGLHRVIFYGDHMADTKRLARFVGFDVVEEG